MHNELSARNESHGCPQPAYMRSTNKAFMQNQEFRQKDATEALQLIYN